MSKVLLVTLLATIGAIYGGTVPDKSGGNVGKSIEIEASYVDMPKGYLASSYPHIGSQLAVGNLDLRDFSGLVLAGKASLGTPNQEFTFIFDIASPHTWVFDVNCNNDACKGKKGFDSSKSTSFKQSNKGVFRNPGLSVQGKYVTDVLNFGGLTTGLTFGLIDTVEPNTIFLAPFDGWFSLTTGVNDVKSPIENVLSQLNEKIVSIWSDKSKLNSSALVTIGAKDTKNCQNDWNFVNNEIIQDDYKFVWAVPVKKFEFGDVKKDVTHKAALVAEFPFIFGPDEFVKPIKEKAKPDGTFFVNCSVRSELPNIKFTIGDKVYEISPQQYILDLPPTEELKGKCMFLVLGIDNQSGKPVTSNTWILGLPFLRSYCIALDFSDQRRVGLAPPISGVGLTMASWMGVVLANLSFIALHKFM